MNNRRELLPVFLLLIPFCFPISADDDFRSCAHLQARAQGSVATTPHIDAIACSVPGIVLRSADTCGADRNLRSAATRWATTVHWARWSMFFMAGLLLPFFGGVFLRPFHRRPPHLVLAALTPAELSEFELIRDTIDRIVQNHDGTAITVASRLHLSQSEVKRKVHRATGMDLSRYLVYLRSEIACERLRSTDAVEKMVALSSGFRDVKELRRAFRLMYGISPADFRSSRRILGS